MTTSAKVREDNELEGGGGVCVMPLGAMLIDEPLKHLNNVKKKITSFWPLKGYFRLVLTVLHEVQIYTFK